MKSQKPMQKSQRQMSSPSRGTWIEISLLQDDHIYCESSPSRGTWIEMWTLIWTRLPPRVVPLTGDVD